MGIGDAYCVTFLDVCLGIGDAYCVTFLERKHWKQILCQSDV